MKSARDTDMAIEFDNLQHAGNSALRHLSGPSTRSYELVFVTGTVSNQFDPIPVTQHQTFRSDQISNTLSHNHSVWEDYFLRNSIIGTGISFLVCLALCLLLFSVVQHAMKVWPKVHKLWEEDEKEKLARNRACHFLIV